MDQEKKLLDSLPPDVRQAVEAQDMEALIKALDALSPEERQRVEAILEELEKLTPAETAISGVPATT